MPKECNVKSQAVEIPKGCYPVSFEKKGKLYVNMNGVIKIFDNPYRSEIPEYVKVQKNKQGEFYIRK